MLNKLTVGVLFGGRSGEHEVSLMSSRSVLQVMDPEKYTIIPIGITPLGKWYVGSNIYEAIQTGNTAGLTRVIMLPEPGDNHLYSIREGKTGISIEPLNKLDVIFPVLHGTYGEDGTMQGLFELADIAYVGAGVLGSSVGMDKSLFKTVMKAEKIPVLDFTVIQRSRISSDLEGVLDDAEGLWKYPLFTKPANLGSSVGISKCRSRSDLMEGVLDAARYDRRVMIEKGLENPIELEVSLLGNDQPEVSLVGEIRPKADFYSYSAKYLDKTSELIIPALVPDSVAEEVRNLAVRAYKACDCAGMARADFLVDRTGMTVYLNEINTIPGFTSISMYPKLWEASGLSYPDLIDRLIGLALDRKKERDATEHEFGRVK